MRSSAVLLAALLAIDAVRAADIEGSAQQQPAGLEDPSPPARDIDTMRTAQLPEPPSLPFFAVEPDASSPLTPALPGGLVWPVLPYNARVTTRGGGGQLAGEDVGLDDGFTWLQGFVPFYQRPGESVLFGEGRTLFYNEGSGQYGANAALGYRVYDPFTDRVWGGYAGYDHRHTDPLNFGQVSAGLESLGRIFDARANGYAVVTGQGDTVTGISNLRYAGYHILMDTSVVSAMSGFDAEVGFNLTPQFPALALRAFTGCYGFFTDHANDAWGPRGRLEARWWNRFTVEGSLQHDQVFKTTGFVSVSILLGGNSPVWPDYPPPVPVRLGDPLKKNMHVVVRQRLLDDVTAINPRTGKAWEVLHFDSSAAAVGNGTFEAPLNTLADPGAQYDIALLHAGSVFSMQSMTLNSDHQRLLGDGAAAPHSFASQFGTLPLPRANTLLTQPIIDQAPAPAAVTIAANNVEVAGLNITRSVGDGIAGMDVAGVNINRNTISMAGQYGVHLDGTLSGTITGNTVANSVSDGFQIGNFQSGTISGNTASGNGLLGGFTFGTVSGGTIMGNTASGNMFDGFRFNTVSGGIISGNTASGNVSAGFSFFNTVPDATISGNTATGNGVGLAFNIVSGGTISGNMASGNIAGFNFFGPVSGGTIISGNVASGNMFQGFFFNDDVSGGTITANTASGNMLQGFYFFKPFTGVSGGTISGNTASGNAREGFIFNAVSGGTISGNTASGNTLDGFSFADITGGLVDSNTASMNTDDGFDIGSFTGGMFNNNVSNSNTAQGYNVGFTAAPASATNNTGMGNGGGFDTFTFP
jgi:parallel beta-helix repeat protein